MLSFDSDAITKLVPKLGERFVLVKKLAEIRKIQEQENKENLSANLPLPLIDGSLHISDLPSEAEAQLDEVVSTYLFKSGLQIFPIFSKKTYCKLTKLLCFFRVILL